MAAKWDTQLKILLLSFAALLAATFGLGYSYHSFITPRSSQGELSKISGDRWLQDGASITLHDLSARGNRALISFNPWRPVEPARLVISVCNKVAARFEVTDPEPKVFSLNGECAPRTIRFEVENPYVPEPLSGKGGDNRELGAQLNFIKITSPLRVPIVQPILVLYSTLIIFLLSLLTWKALNNFFIGLAVPLLGGVLISLNSSLKLEPSWALSIFLGAILVGIIIGRSRLKTSLSPIKVPPKLSGILIFGIVITSALLRFYGLDFGLPANFHPDEVPKFNAIMNMKAAGDLNPRYFLHPSLLLYSTYFVNTLYQAFVAAGEWGSTVILSGRIVSATAGTLSVLITYLIGRSLFSFWPAALGSLILAFSPLHITCSRYVKEDSLLTFFTLLAIYLVIIGAKERKNWCLYLGGIAIGAAASTKYSGILGAFILLGVPWLRSGSMRPAQDGVLPTLVSCLMVPIGFLIFSPYIVLDHSTFLRDFATEREHMIIGHAVSIDAWSQFWMYHFYRSIIPGMTFVASIVGVAGLGLLLYRREVPGLYLIALFLLFYLPAEFVKAKPAPQPERYMVPCLPFLSLAAGVFLSVILTLKHRVMNRFGRVVIFILMSVTLLSPFYRSVTLASEIKDDSRLIMLRWISENLPRNSTIITDWKPYNPPFVEGEFNIVYLPREDIISNIKVSELKGSGGDYLLLSSLYYDRFFSQPNSNPAIRSIVRETFKTFPIIKEIRAKYGTYGFHNPTLILFDLKNIKNSEPRF